MLLSRMESDITIGEHMIKAISPSSSISCFIDTPIPGLATDNTAYKCVFLYSVYYVIIGYEVTLPVC